MVGGLVGCFVLSVGGTHQYLKRGEGYYLRPHTSGEWSAKLRNFFEVRGISAVCVRESMVWVGLNAVLVTKFRVGVNGFNALGRQTLRKPISGGCEWGAGPTIGPEPGGSKMRA